jgi:translation initiation factor IF-2
MAGNKFYRLFKVAKELNVSTDNLVDSLREKGHAVEHSPNTKLSGELYDILLKEFASDKIKKERADQIVEKRREEVRTNTVQPQEEENEREHISAEDLRNRITRPRRRRASSSSEEPATVTKTKPTIEVPTPKKEVPEASPEVPPVSKPEVPAEPEQDSPPRLKVVGKIDLDAVSGKKKPPKTQNQEKVEPPVEPPKKEVAKETPVAPKSEPPVEKPVEKPAVTPPVTETSKQKEEITPVVPPVVESKSVEPPQKEDQPVEQQPVAKTQGEQPTAKEQPVKTTEETEEKPTSEEQDPETVMRAGDRTPSLRGLKVMGKIELPSDRKNRKKEDSSNSKTENKATAGEGEDGNKKRRRRRKRKRKSSGTETTQSTTSDASKRQGGRVKKEKPTEKEVDQSIRNTLSQMGKSPSRSRQRLRRAKRDADAARREQLEMQLAEDERILELTEFITVNEFAQMIGVSVTEIISKVFQLGVMVSINQRLDAELLTLIAEEYGYEINFVDVTDTELEELEIEDDPADLEERAPIITVMGHVDHGKTTLLDFLRKTNVTASEAGGITQHIGAYEVKLKSGRVVTFLDTPGHEAFTAMRARGAKATDVAIIVIAADDAVMPQTREAINHAQAAEVPMIFAFNKIDKAGADAERIKGQLAEMNILVEDWGGNFQSQEISALKGINVDELLEKVTLEADLLELKANPDRVSTGTVIESRLDRGRGNVATLLVQNGTLKVGDEMVAGIHYGKVRALIDQNGQRTETAGPSQPVQILGLNGQPQAGDKFYIFEEDGKAKEIARRRSELFREQQMRQTNRLTLEEIGRRRALGNFKELNIIIRGDVDGSVEALSGSLLKLSTDEVQVNIIMKAVGAITEADINLAIASDAIVIAFNVRPNAQARSLAEREAVDIRTYSVIYDAINEVKDALEGLLSPEIREEIIGTAEILEVFRITKVGNVAGARVTSGKINRDDKVRLIRDGVVIYDSSLESLKRYKDDVKEVINGQECGFMIKDYQDIKEGDVVEAYRENEIRRTL